MSCPGFEALRAQQLVPRWVRARGAHTLPFLHLPLQKYPKLPMQGMGGQPVEAEQPQQKHISPLMSFKLLKTLFRTFPYSSNSALLSQLATVTFEYRQDSPSQSVLVSLGGMRYEVNTF